MAYGYILIIIPIVLLTAFIVMIAKRMTEGSSLVEAFGMKNAVLGVIVLMVGMLVMIPIIDSADPAYEYDSDSKTFTVYRNITGTEFSWGNATAAESLIVENGVTTISDGAFADFDDLKYISIPESATDIGTNAFGVTLKDYMDRTMSDPEAGEYVGFGDGTLYYCDASIFTYNTIGAAVIGLTSEAASAVNIVLPNVHSSKTIAGVASNSFENRTTIERLIALPDSHIQLLGTSAFSGCTSLAAAGLPDSLVTIGGNVFKNTGLTSVVLPSTVTTSGGADFEGCTSLASVELSPSLTAISNRMFLGCTSLASLEIPSSVTSIGTASFQNCAALASLEIPSSVTSIGGSAFSGCSSLTTFSFSSSLDTLGSWAFSGCIGATSVTFAIGFAPSTYDPAAFRSWRFYDTDGTTVISADDAANLAGFTFQGTATALVKVAPGQLSLTPDQLQQVQLHTQELQDLKDRLDIDPLPFQPSLQTEQEQVAA